MGLHGAGTDAESGSGVGDRKVGEIAEHHDLTLAAGQGTKQEEQLGPPGAVQDFVLRRTRSPRIRHRMAAGRAPST